jgi:GNAT superfamily N-acetyltransferase
VGDGLLVRPFEPGDQAVVRALILDGLKEHFGFLDDTLNQDLDDIAQAYADSLFLVAVMDDQVVGTGCLKPGVAGDANVVRMSTMKEARRRGVGRAILDHLINHARKQGYTRLTLGTSDDWADAIAFYEAVVSER